MDQFIIRGGRKLEGSIEVETSKNATLPIIAACILTDEEIVLEKIPQISDVYKMLEILKWMGASVRWEDDSVIICTKEINKAEIPSELAKEIRSSVFMLGPLLAKFKVARVAYPGGCDIGSRPIDLHLSGLRDLGVTMQEDYGFIDCEAEHAKSGVVHLDFPSVGATENIMMSAVFLKGETIIMNAAKEPEIVDLANFINKLGGKIFGAGTSTITVSGVEKLGGCTYKPIADRIIAGTYLIAVAMTGGKIRLEKVNYQDVYALLNKLRNAGCSIDYDNENIFLQCTGRPISCSSIETQPFPGFPTDLQAQILAMQTISNGISVITENLFETRFKHVPELIKMGAKVTTKDRMAIVRGVPELHGAQVTAYDLRGGAALVLAGLTTSDQTVVQNVKFIDRGYDKFEEKLCMLGADVVRKCEK